MIFKKDDNVEVVNPESTLFRRTGTVLRNRQDKEYYNYLVKLGDDEMWFRYDELTSYTPDNGEDPERFEPR